MAKCVVTGVNSLRPFGFDDHQRSAEHQTNLGFAEKILAPTASLFERVIRATRRAETFIDGCIGRFKFRLMKWRVAEAKRERNRR